MADMSKIEYGAIRLPLWITIALVPSIEMCLFDAFCWLVWVYFFEVDIAQLFSAWFPYRLNN